MGKNIAAPPTQIRDNGGNTVSFIWSRGKAITLSGDFAPNFSFLVFVSTGGDIVIEPNDNNLDELPPSEKAFFSGETITLTVEDGTFLPILCKRIVASGTTATGLIVGK